MVERTNKWWVAVAVLFDSIATLLAFTVAYHLRVRLGARYPNLPPLVPFHAYLWIPAVAIMTEVLVLVCYAPRGLRKPQSVSPHFRAIALSCVLLVLVLAVVNSALKPVSFSRLMTTFFIMLNYGFLLISHGVQVGLQRAYGGELSRNAIVLGKSPEVFELAEQLRAQYEPLINVIGVVTENGEAEKKRRLPVLGAPGDIRRILDEKIIDIAILMNPLENPRQTAEVVQQCREIGVNVYMEANFPNISGTLIQLEWIGNRPFLLLSSSPHKPVALFIKRCIDVVLSALLMVLLSPLMLLIAAGVKLTSPGRVIFKQRRCGLNGRIFTMYKFRSMHEGADERARFALHAGDGPPPKLPNDPRVTKFGKFLRRFSLDELPQLWNVLKGDMSLVGPRPVPPEEVKTYKRWQRRRLSMKPGLTCLWQISGRSALPFEEWMRLDLEYIDNWNLLLDLKIMLKTLPAIISGKGSY